MSNISESLRKESEWIKTLPRLTPKTNGGYVVRLKRGNAIPVLATSPTGVQYIYNSIAAFVKDTIGPSRRVTAQRRVREGGGKVRGWHVKPLRDRRAERMEMLAMLDQLSR